MSEIELKIKKMSPRFASWPMPSYATEHAVGLDLRACLEKDVLLEPGQRMTIPTGVSVQIPVGFEGQVRPRSGLAAKMGIGIVNSPGTIDPDYRGEVSVILINHGQDGVVIKPGDRIAQMVLSPVVRCRVVEASELRATERGEGGFGSTGR